MSITEAAHALHAAINASPDTPTIPDIETIMRAHTKAETPLQRIMREVAQTSLCVEAMQKADQAPGPFDGIGRAYAYVDRLGAAALDQESSTDGEALMHLMFGIHFVTRATGCTVNPPHQDYLALGLALLHAAARGIERLGEVNHVDLGLQSICELEASPSDVIGRAVNEAGKILAQKGASA